MKKTLLVALSALTLVIALGFGFIPRTETTASCAADECAANEDLKFVKDIFKKFAEECGKEVPEGEKQPKLCLVSNVYQKVFPKLRELARDGRYLPGDRTLLIGETQEGKLRLGIERAFLAFTPMGKDSLIIAVTKKDGNGGAIIRICAADENGNFTRLNSIRFDDNSKPETKTVTVTGVKGKIVKILVNSFSGPFGYSLKTTPN
jgi:hypothetical protein